ncbi:MAG: acyl-CoA dehydrogenase family protein [Planctomycetes bacterium]|nr:acyl-CoA dehydrogenase family protein [Planctomycetota bacterium]MCB9886243.1 acyl-CoA dehydrogenase family protein [Planctomycetota bacterium]
MHNLQLTEDQDLIVDTVRKFVADVVAPKVLDQDEHRQFVRAEFDGLAELGLFGLCVSEANGGVGMGYVPFVAALESIGEHSSSLARLWIGQAQAAAALEAAGSDELEAVIGGAVLATYVGPEYGVVFADGKLQGSADLVSAGMHADKIVVAATAAGAPVLVLVEGAAVEKRERRALGLASAGPAQLLLDGVAATSLATGDAAASAIARADLTAWIGCAATAIGGGFASIAAAKKHAGERIAFGKPLLKQQAVADKLVEAARVVEAARHVTWHAARLADLGNDATAVAMQAKLSAIDAMVFAADEAIQIHGGFGYTVEYHVERHYRDGKALEVLDGGSGALRALLAARQLA